MFIKASAFVFSISLIGAFFHRSWKISRPSSHVNCNSNENVVGEISFKIASFNILAPIYNRADINGLHIRESENQEKFISRNIEICDLIESTGADIVCIQEFWGANQYLQELYTERIGSKLGYTIKELPRTSEWGKRDDGIALFIKEERLIIQDYQEILFHDCGDRVAQLVLLALLPQPQTPYPQSVLSTQNDKPMEKLPPQQILCVNTHLLFPHNEYSTNIRVREVTKILGFAETYRQTELCTTICGRSDVRIPVIIAGDFNGSPRGSVYQLMKSQNYLNAMEEFQNVSSLSKILKRRKHLPSSESAADDIIENQVVPGKWISHRNHKKAYVPVDHVFFSNPSGQVPDKLPPVPDWTLLVFRELRQRLGEKLGNSSDPASLREIFAAFDLDNTSYITRDEFRTALHRLGFAQEGTPALTSKEMEALIASADVDGNGRIDYDEFVYRFWRAEQARLTVAAESDETPELGYETRLAFLREKSKNLTLPDKDLEKVSMEKEASRVAGRDNRTNASTTISAPPSNALVRMRRLRASALRKQSLENARPMGDLRVRSVTLYPKELELGHWPSSYTMSDHGLVVVEFVGQMLGPIPLNEIINPSPYATKAKNAGL